MTEETMTSNKSNSDKILDLWNCLERWLNCHRKGTIDDLVKDSQYAGFRSDALFLRNIRNILVHNDRNLIQLSDEAVSRCESFVNLVTEESLAKYMIPSDELCLATRTDKVRPYLERLLEMNYSYLPVVTERKNPICLHVFSAYTLMAYIAKHAIDDNTTFADVDNYMQEQDRYQAARFYSVKTPLIDVIDAFKPNANFHTDVALVTKDGKRTSPLMGMITVWNILDLEHV